MKRNRTLLLAAVAATFAACSGDSPSEPPAPTVASVAITPLTPSIPVGQTQQLTATARSSTGSTVSGLTVSWSTSAPNVATVSSSGLVTGVAPGQAAITATVDGVANSTVVTVTEPQQACAAAKTVTLSPGQSQAYELADCIILPSGASGDRYRVAVIRPTQDDKDTGAPQATLSVTGLGVTQAPAPVSPSVLVARPESPVPGLSQAAIERAHAISSATERFHRDMREREAELVRRLGTDALLPRRPASGAAHSVVLQATSPDKIILDTTTSGCSTTPAAKKTAILVHENDDLAIYQDSTQRATKPIGVGLAQKMTTYYSAYSKSMIEAYFGPPTDIDENGKMIVFASPVVEGDVAAFVWSGDFFENDTTVQGSCAASNEAEVIYFNTDLILNMEGNDPAYQALATLAHEVKHVVSLYNRIAASQRLGSSQYHPSWIEEGTAEIAGEMSSRIAWAANSGPAVGAQVTRTSFVNTPGGITEHNYGVAINLARAVWFLSSQPNGLVATPTGATEGSSIYGSGWMFHRWLGDAYGNATKTAQGDSAFFRELNDSLAARGVTGITTRTGKSFDTLLNEFYAEIMLHQTAAPAGPRPFHTYDFLTATNIFSNPNPPGDFPWPVTMQGEVPTVSFQTRDFTGPIGASGVRIHDFLSNGTGTGAQIRLDMTPPGRMLVTRLR